PHRSTCLSRSSPCPPCCSSSSFSASRDHRALHSFPTRRSSDLHGPERQVEGHEERLGQADQERGVERSHERSHASDDHHHEDDRDRKSTRLNSSHVKISYAVFCLKKKKKATGQAIEKVEEDGSS